MFLINTLHRYEIASCFCISWIKLKIKIPPPYTAYSLTHVYAWVSVMACDRYRQMSGCRHGRNGYFLPPMSPQLSPHTSLVHSYWWCIRFGCLHLVWIKRINPVNAVGALQGPVCSPAPQTCHVWSRYELELLYSPFLYGAVCSMGYSGQ